MIVASAVLAFPACADLRAEPLAEKAIPADSCEPGGAVVRAMPAGSGSSTAEAAPARAPHDWAWLCRYRSDNVAALATTPPVVVFFGDSITENWAREDSEFFRGGYLNRGIGGQTSAHMLLRFYEDVVLLRPKVVHIVAGSNDVARNAGSMGEASFRNNIRAMVELAQGHDIRVILGSIPPAASFPWRTEIQPVDEIRALNRWLREYANERQATFADYYGAMAAPDGAMRDGTSADGVHPNAAGYRLMRKLAENALAVALAFKHQ